MAETKSTIKVLCLEDKPNDAELLKEMLTDAGYEVDMDIAEDEAGFASSLKVVKYNVILADYTLPGYNASEALKLARMVQPETPFICISGTIGEDQAVELIKQGATDYVLKDRLGRLVFTVDRALNDAMRLKEWKTAQDELRNMQIIELQNAELKRLNATKDKFFSIIAHDLRNPFNSILGFSEILMDKVHTMDKENLERMARIINDASKMAMDLLTNLIEWSLAQSGKIDFHPTKILISDVLKEIEPLFAPSARQKNIVIKKELSPQMTVYADVVLLGTVIRNLVSNAIKFSHPGGKVTISAQNQKNMVVIHVTDSGVGIPESNIKRLFKIDENVSTRGTNDEKGTGLGLILCHEFVEKHGGRIWVTSRENDGSTFSFSLPSGSNNQPV